MEPNYMDSVLLHLGRVESKVDSLLEYQNTMASDVRMMTSRINKLENYKSWLLGVAAAISAVIAWCFDTF